MKFEYKEKVYCSEQDRVIRIMRKFLNSADETSADSEYGFQEVSSDLDMPWKVYKEELGGPKEEISYWSSFEEASKFAKWHNDTRLSSGKYWVNYNYDRESKNKR